MIKQYRVYEHNGRELVLMPEGAIFDFGGYTREDIKTTFYLPTQPFTVVGFHEQSPAVGLFYSSAAIIDYPNTFWIRKEVARRGDYKIAGSGQLPAIHKTSLGNVVVLICYDAYRYSKMLSHFDLITHSNPVDIVIIPSDWRENFSVIETAAKQLGKHLKCPVLIADQMHGLTIINHRLGMLRFKEIFEQLPTREVKAAEEKKPSGELKLSIK